MNLSNSVPEVSVAEFALEMRSDTPPRILDVRELDELAISALPGAVHIPVGDLDGRWKELDPSADWVVLCRSGMRSATATRLMLSVGFTRVRNIVGGINAYAKSVDPSLTVY